MNKEQYCLIKLCFTFTLTFQGLINYSILGLAQPTSPAERNSEQIQIRFPQQSSDGSSRGRPGGRGGT
ncbi:hypothetical protein ACE1CI_21780, partial [Aerosakkonemataceae cyanobacterium BLCC-F50]